MSQPNRCLAVIETHPVQYRAPVYRALQERYGVNVTAIYGSDFSLAGYVDPQFKSKFAWDTDLLSGYSHTYLSTIEHDGGTNADTVSSKGLAKAIRDVNPSAILLVGYSPRFHQAACWHAYRSGRPLLFRAETVEHAHTASIKSLIRSSLLTNLYRHFAKLLYIGRHSHRHFTMNGCPEEKLVFSPYCVDTTPFEVDEHTRIASRAQTRACLRLNEDDVAMLFVGKLYDWKRPDLLISALKMLSLKHRSKNVAVFVGSGELQPALASSAASDPFVPVRFVGFQNQKQLSPYYHAADLMVLPSRSETWGLVVNEALHHGLPCVVSDAVGCAPDLIESGVTGEVFGNGSVESLAAAITRAFPLIGRKETRQACRGRVAAYSVDSAAQGIAQAYESVA